MQHEDALPMELYSVYVPTNHIYVGDIFLLGKEDIIHTNLSVREGLGKPLILNPAISLVNGMLCWMQSNLLVLGVQIAY